MSAKKSIGESKKLTVSLACFLGLLLWGVPAVFLYPTELGLIYLFLLVSYIVCNLNLSYRNTGYSHHNLASNKRHRYVVSVARFFSISYLLVDSLVGRQNFDGNFFLSGESVIRLVDIQNNEKGRGRGFWELLAAILLFMPFLLIDLSANSRASVKLFAWTAAVLLVFYEIEASRGFLIVAATSLFLAKSEITLKSLVLVLTVGVALFVFASAQRGDFSDTSFSNPVFSGVAWPFINLGMYLNADCGEASTLEFISQIFSKLLPSFLIDKNVISFNIDASECMYGLSLEELGAVSVFTFLGELTHYTPNLLTAIVAGVFLGVSTRLIDSFLLERKFYVTQLFVGLWIILLLRSRILDVFSSLLALALFFMLITIFRSGYLKYFLPLKVVNK